MVLYSKQKDSHIIKWRSHEPGRLETFSDAVFAFAITLVIVALEVPESFNELHEMMLGFFSFAACFAMIFYIWNIQNTFFRRYGLKDSYTYFLNAVLLFTVLFYVYPLKFLCNMISNGMLYHRHVEITTAQIPSLMYVYHTGYIIIFTLFFLMYSNAFKRARELDLSGAEKYHTNSLRYSFLFNAFAGLLALFAACLFPARYAGSSGFIYFLIGPALGTWHSIRGNRVRKMVAHEAAG